MFALSLLVEGPARVGQAFGTAFTASALPADLGLLYIVVAGSLVGYGIWSRLMGRYPSSTVAPFSMLVPVIGVLASWAAFGEVPDVVEVVAGAVVVVAVLWSSRTSRLVPAADAETPPSRRDAAGSGTVSAAPDRLAQTPASRRAAITAEPDGAPEAGGTPVPQPVSPGAAGAPR